MEDEGGSKWDGEGGRIPLSPEKDEANDLLKIVALRTGSVIRSPLGVRRGAELGGGTKKRIRIGIKSFDIITVNNICFSL